MKCRQLIAFAASIAAVAALAAPASAGSPNIGVIDNEFTNPQFSGDVGTTMVWEWGSMNVNEHNVVQDKKLFNSGDPVVTGPDFALDPSAGTFPYYCELHGNKGGLGMAGKFRMIPAEGFLKRGSTQVIWSYGSNDTGNQFDVQYRKQGSDKWKDWKKNTTQDQAEFGGNNKPIDVDPSKIYEIRARSEKASNPKKKRSGWSPPLVIEFT